MLCRCHGEPCYLQRQRGRPDYWRCAVTKRERQRGIDQARRDVKVQRQRDRYDNDPVYRIGHNLRKAAQERRAAIERRREALRVPSGVDATISV